MREVDNAEGEYVTVKEVAQRYRISLGVAYSVAARLPHTLRLGTAVRVWRGDLNTLEANGKEDHG